MKLTNQQLKQIIKEELTRILAEEDVPMDRPHLSFADLAAGSEDDIPVQDEELYYENLE